MTKIEEAVQSLEYHFRRIYGKDVNIAIVTDEVTLNVYFPISLYPPITLPFEWQGYKVVGIPAGPFVAKGAE